MKAKRNRIFSCNDLLDKEKRSLAILELIRKKGAISRTDLSRTTGVNVVSISNYVSSFIEKGLVVEKGLAASSGGRKPGLVELNVANNFCVGVDLCADEITVILVDIGMKRLAKKTSPRPGNRGEVAAAVIAAIDAVLKESSASEASEASAASAAKVRAVGIGLCSEKLFSVRDEVEKKYGVETFAAGEAVCGAYAEKELASREGLNSILYMHSDLGRAVFIDGDRCLGYPGEISGAAPAAADGSSGGDATKYLNPWPECLGIVGTAKREVERGVGTKIVSLAGGKVEKITARVVIDAAREKDETALGIIQGIGTNLGLRIAYLINLFGPEAVVIGGGMEEASDIAMPFIVKMAGRLSVKKYANSVKMAPSVLGREGLCLGACALAVREVFVKA
jgi:predicted NBD/HSP70 family sugar kinase